MLLGIRRGSYLGRNDGNLIVQVTILVDCDSSLAICDGVAVELYISICFSIVD